MTGTVPFPPTRSERGGRDRTVTAFDNRIELVIDEGAHQVDHAAALARFLLAYVRSQPGIPRANITDPAPAPEDKRG
jgi:hypothetical protein